MLLGGIVLLSAWGGLTRIHDRNAAVERGAAAYVRRDYAAAAVAYKEAAVTLESRDEAVWLNLAHATARAGRPGEAREYYNHLTISKNLIMRSVALQQLGALAAAKGDYAQAISLLRQSLLANAANAEARFNYERLRDYLARQTTPPQLPPPGTDGNPEARQPEPTAQTQPRAGTDQRGQLTDPALPRDPRNAPQPRPDANGLRDPKRPSAQPGSAANSGFQPGSGEQRTVARGSQPGNVRGISDEETGPEAPGGSSRRGGSEAASAAEINLQTQRARLQQMNLSSGQARQLLEALHTAEQQYLQQLPRKATKPQVKGKPGW
ncbi:tetratricopeptide repeat protein [Hymenobacter perfusus]|uniref:tetratricopeptide repeat protein n=1 Tax=Hymenobacter perfusus TaxID=1236770 RepID=UPI00147700E3|nr:tetratricopeptide repeat protein [Hymenobacter perfusus]